MHSFFLSNWNRKLFDVKNFKTRICSLAWGMLDVGFFLIKRFEQSKWRAPPCGRPIRVIIRLFIHQEFLVWSICSLPLALSDSYFTHIVGKGCTVTLNQVSTCRPKVRVIKELQCMWQIFFWIFSLPFLQSCSYPTHSVPDYSFLVKDQIKFR